MTQFWKGGLIVFFGLMLFVLMTSKGIEPGVLVIEPRAVHKSLVAAVGQDVTLDCDVDQSINFEWEFNDVVYVLVYSNGFPLDNQGEQFKGRASEGDKWDLNIGKVPVKISSLQKSDAGMYRCHVMNGKLPKEICSITLNVIAAGVEELRAKDRTTKGQSCKTIGDTVLTLVLATSTLLHFLHY
ncbi:hypothetical protein OYC64_001288 [Pagothenia borchgrevinki]|uniref:Ig-like domain-containing protein n=1 Tax=Pagothenia borchgrevinki TaxID=8213 RepID=A0ABD2GA19_PAGBO